MTYATLMVHLPLGRSNKALLQVAADLAEQFHAGVIGIAACKPAQIIYDQSYLPADLFQQDRHEIEREMKETEAEFRHVFHQRAAGVEWRSRVTYGLLSDYIAAEARSADLVITAVDTGNELATSRAVSTSDLVMQVGRPVLIVPSSAADLKPERVMICWKDTRETRRATLDALPLLKKAARVSVVEIATEPDQAAARIRIEAVVGWLKRHGVAAEMHSPLSTGDNATQLDAIAQAQNVDLIVAGAYGHSRLREWALGGVTRDLLLSGSRCSLVSH